MQSCNDFMLLNAIQLFEKYFDGHVCIIAEIDTLPAKGTHENYSRCVYFPSSVTKERNFRFRYDLKKCIALKRRLAT